MLGALIWDVDGTLAETERDGHRIAFNQAFAEAGLDWHWDVARYGELLAVTGGRERMLHDWQQQHPGQAEPVDLRDRIAVMHRRKNAIFADIVRSGSIPLRPGVERLIREAHAAGLRQAIATTTSRDNCLSLLESAFGDRAAALFEVIVCGEDVRAKKPDPEVYRIALEQLGLPESRCIAIEDSPPGFEAATRAALPCVVTRSLYNHDFPVEWMQKPQPLAVLEDLDTPIYDGAGAIGVEQLRTWHAHWLDHYGRASAPA